MCDFINLSATYYNLLTGNKEADQELKDRGYTSEQINAVNKNKKSTEIKFNGLVFTKSLKSFHYPLIGYALLLLENYELGNLPFGGTISDQPAQVMEIITVLRNIQSEYKTKIEKQNLESFQRKSKT